MRGSEIDMPSFLFLAFSSRREHNRKKYRYTAKGAKIALLAQCLVLRVASA